MTDPDTKRQKMAASSASIIRPSLLEDPSARQALAASYSAGAPYPHCIIPEICDPSLLRAVRDEIIDNIQATYKETDLFKMLQTGDLANMDKLDAASAAKLPTLLALRDAIYSPAFRSFVTDITGCGDLSDKTDCACNVHPVGGHLLCHDDVIGDRRVSYIIYLTDPDDPWVAEDGGALELYPEAPSAANTPDVIPTATVLPTWNAMAMFTVQPGRSFHSIQEVYATEKPRMSIQGWFHAPAPPGDAALATLQQLQTRPGESDAGEYTPFSEGNNPNPTSTSGTAGGTAGGTADPPTGGDLSDDDLSLLIRWVNPAYLAEDAATKVQAKFQEDGSVQLAQFLKKDRAQEIAEAIREADAADNLGSGKVPKYDAGIGGGWSAVGPAHKQRYLKYNNTSEGGSAAAVDGSTAAEKAGALLQRIQHDLLSTGAFARLVRRLTTLTMLGYRSEVRRFRPGLDYSVAHYGVLTQDPRLDAVLCFVADSDEESRAAWDNGEVGGFEAYLLADEDEDKPAEVYRAGADDDSGVLNVSPASNTLNLVLRDEGLMRFVKYLSCQAPSSRWDVAAVLLPEDDSDSEEEGDEEEEEEG